jgi:uncharacterized membrane-anchored protein YhcB (DUF1043 family)
MELTILNIHFLSNELIYFGIAALGVVGTIISSRFINKRVKELLTNQNTDTSLNQQEFDNKSKNIVNTVKMASVSLALSLLTIGLSAFSVISNFIIQVSRNESFLLEKFVYDLAKKNADLEHTYANKANEYDSLKESYSQLQQQFADKVSELNTSTQLSPEVLVDKQSLLEQSHTVITTPIADVHTSFLLSPFLHSPTFAFIFLGISSLIWIWFTKLWIQKCLLTPRETTLRKVFGTYFQDGQLIRISYAPLTVIILAINSILLYTSGGLALLPSILYLLYVLVLSIFCFIVSATDPEPAGFKRYLGIFLSSSLIAFCSYLLIALVS